MTASISRSFSSFSRCSCSSWSRRISRMEALRGGEAVSTGAELHQRARQSVLARSFLLVLLQALPLLPWLPILVRVGTCMPQAF